MNIETCNIVLGGIGGQGILKASEICGWAALYEGYHVKKSEVHGMAQRGGSVESHLRFGRRVFSPLVSRAGADFLLCFHEEEHPRLKPYLRKGGRDLLRYLDAARKLVAQEPRALNTAMVGVLSRELAIGEAAWEKALETVFPPKLLAFNRGIFFEARAIER